MEDDQIHPLHDIDKEIVNSLIVKELPEDLDLINLARLFNRYDKYPGEKELKQDLNKILMFWKLTKDALFTKTRKLWATNFRPSNMTKDLIGSGFDTSN